MCSVNGLWRTGLVALCLAAFGCSNHAQAPAASQNVPTGVATAAIGPAGGTLSVTTAQIPDLSGTSITVPAGALTDTVMVTITESSDSVAQAGQTAAGPVADFAPDGTQFAVPVTITVPVSVAANVAASDLLIEAVEGSGAAYGIEILSQADGYATFQSMGFTRFGCIHHPPADGGLCASDSDCICSVCENGACGGVPCFCPEVAAGGCTAPGPGPCCCPMSVPCDGGMGAADAGPVVCNCPEIPSGGCTTPGPAPCHCPIAVACDGGTGDTCTSDSDCPAKDYCDTPTCGGSGKCTPKPEVCPEYCTSPGSCGCDGKYYCNPCLAEAEGVSVTSDDSVCGGSSDAGPIVCPCPAIPPGACSEPGPAPCHCQQEVPCDAGPVCSCPAAPAGAACTGPAPCDCPVACDAGPVCSCPAAPAGASCTGPAPCHCPVACDAGASGSCTSNAECPAADEYCAASTCGGDGTCQDRPTVCPQDCMVPELCGCNGQLYCNACMANAAGTNVSPSSSLVCGL